MKCVKNSSMNRRRSEKAKSNKRTKQKQTKKERGDTRDDRAAR